MGKIPNMGTKTFSPIKEERADRELTEESKTLSNKYSPEITKLTGNRFIRALKVLIGKL